jgi:ferritin-like metal-binding protein YciE
MARAQLYDVFVEELVEMYDAEHQMAALLGRMASQAASPGLRRIFETHLAETRRHVERLESVFLCLTEDPGGARSVAMAGIVHRATVVFNALGQGPTSDACLIAACHRAELFEVACYTTLVGWARAIGQDEIAILLQETLFEEHAVAQQLRDVAAPVFDQVAAASGPPHDVASDCRR